MKTKKILYKKIKNRIAMTILKVINMSYQVSLSLNNLAKVFKKKLNYNDIYFLVYK